MSRGPKKTLTLSTVSRVDDDMGNDTETWTSGKSMEGVFSVLSDNERSKFGKIGENASHRFTVDYVFCSSVTLKDRFVSGTRIFQIVGKDDPLEMHHSITFLLSEDVDDA